MQKMYRSIFTQTSTNYHTPSPTPVSSSQQDKTMNDSSDSDEFNEQNLPQGAVYYNYNITVGKSEDLHIGNRVMPTINCEKELASLSINVNESELPSAIKTRLKTTDMSYSILKEKLQQLYGYITLPKVAWLDGGYDLPMSEYFVELQLNHSNASIDVNEIFNPVKTKRPLRILIEGQPGFGKTTLATKLAHDWAQNKEYINDFELAFFMPLRELRGQSIDNAIELIGRQCDYQDDQIIRIVNRHREKTLFILDGLDEVSLDERQEIMKILYKQIYSAATVVLFCRTGLFEFSTKERTKLFGLSNVSRNFYDKQISILGIQSLRRKKEFLLKFIPETMANNITKCLLPQFDLFDSPLLLMLLPVILEEDEDVGLISTRTEFYKKIFNCILKHSYVKRGRSIATDFDLFRLNSSPNAIQDQIRRFGILSMENIRHSKLKFESNDLVKEIYELGFLISHKEIKCFKSLNHFEALHLSVIEFTSAFALWVEFKFNQSAFAENLLVPAINDFIESKATSLILPFLAGLTEDDLDHLLFHCSPMSAWFSLDFDLIVKLLSDCSQSNICKSKCLRNFISPDLKITGMTAHKYLDNGPGVQRELVKYGTKCGQIKRININEETIFKMMTNKIETCLQINITTVTGIWFTAYSNVPCELRQIFQYWNSFLFCTTLDDCLRFAVSAGIESCYLDICSSSLTATFVELVTAKEIFNKIKYRYLQIEITSIHQKQVIENLLRNNQVQSLELFGNYKLDMSDFCCIAAQSSILTRVRFRNVSIDLYDLTNGGTKKYANMDICFCTLTCKRPLLLRNCCNNLEISCLPRIEAITEMDPDSLECYNIKIDDFIDKYPSWTGFKSVKCLTLRGNYDKFMVRLVSVWKNLQTLHLQFDDQPDNEEMLANCLQNLPIVKLVIEKHFKFSISNFFKSMNNVRAKENNSRLNTIDFVDSKLNTSECEILELIEGLKCNHWDKVNLVSTNKVLRQVRKSLLNSEVTVTHSNYQSTFPEFDRFKIYYYTYLPRIKNALSLTRQ